MGSFLSTLGDDTAPFIPLTAFRSGKTTQLPKICLDLGRGQSGLIGHTQPRRLAARAVAARIAEEVGTEMGQGVGYQVRFNDQSSLQTSVKLMTDGILLAEIPYDRLLRNYDTIIIDEAHERSLNIDFLLGYLKEILPERPDLKVLTRVQRRRERSPWIGQWRPAKMPERSSSIVYENQSPHLRSKQNSSRARAGVRGSMWSGG